VELEAEHFRVRGFGGHDFEAHALYLGLHAIGESKRALELMQEYVEKHRGSNWPLPTNIRQIIEDGRAAQKICEASRALASHALSESNS
jgi:hypothetical protein